VLFKHIVYQTKIESYEKKLVTKLSKMFALASVLSGENMNKARRNFIISFMMSLMVVRHIHFHALARHLNDEVKDASNLRRIQDFMANYELSYKQIAILLSLFLPAKGKWHLSIDRTNWKVGQTKHNILAITVYCKGIGVPIYFCMLENKGGNSSQKQRIKLLQKFITTFSLERIESIAGDREFIGSNWLHFITQKGINFYIRLKDNQTISCGGVTKCAKNWVNPKRVLYLQQATIKGEVKVNVYLKRTKKKKRNGEPENLIIVTNTTVNKAKNAYKQRWSIETFFQAIKGRGFNLEETHVQDTERLKKLFALVCLTFACCLTIGIHKHEKVEPIKMKNHGYKANSFARYGLDELCDAFGKFYKKFQHAEQLIDKIIDNIQKAANQWIILRGNTLFFSVNRK